MDPDIDDNSRSNSITGVTAAMLGLSLVTVALRCFVRVRVVNAFGWDDGTMVLAMVLNLGFAICGITGAHYGMGKKTDWFLTHADYFHRALFCWWLGQIFYIFTCVVAKLSIIISLLRITIDRIHCWILYAAMTLTLIVGLIFFFFTVFQCHPVDFFWNRMSEEGHCINSNTLIDIAYLYSVGAATADFTIGLLPVFIIWNLRMNPRAKLAIAGILGIGCIASAAVIIRIPYIQNYKSRDFLWATTSISIWSNVEAGLGITAGSLTTLRPLIRFLRDGSSASRTPHSNTFPLSNHFGNGGGFMSGKSKSNPNNYTSHEDARQLWTGPDADECNVTTTIMGSRGPNSNSEEELNRHGSVINPTGPIEPEHDLESQGRGERLKVERSFRVSVRNE